ncbi:MAG: 3'-5' exonuclease [Methanogenium sp.]|jgi:DNA polymerase III epsilon subunit-like protein
MNTIKTIIFLDTETTGVNFLKDEIVQASAIKVDALSASVLSVMNVYIDATGKNLDQEALAVNGYYKGKWKTTKPALVESKKKAAFTIYEFIKDAECIFSHNAPFDKGFVYAHISKHSNIEMRTFPRYWYDTMSFAFLFKYKLPDFKYVSLDYCRREFQIAIRRDNEHDALQDCYILKDVFFKMIKNINIKLPI